MARRNQHVCAQNCRTAIQNSGTKALVSRASCSNRSKVRAKSHNFELTGTHLPVVNRRNGPSRSKIHR